MGSAWQVEAARTSAARLFALAAILFVRNQDQRVVLHPPTGEARQDVHSQHIGAAQIGRDHHVDPARLDIAEA